MSSEPQGYVLKKRLFLEGLKKHRVRYMVGLKRLAVELDHINGNHYDNRIINLKDIMP